MCVGGVLALILLSAIVPGALVKLYTDNESLIAMSLPVLKVVNISAIFLATGFVLFNGVMGTGKTNVSFVIEFFVLVAYLVYVTLVVRILGGGITMAWTSEIVYGLLMSGLSLRYLAKGRWKQGAI